jgi:hypothetical protein
MYREAIVPMEEIQFNYTTDFHPNGNKIYLLSVDEKPIQVGRLLSHMMGVPLLTTKQPQFDCLNCLSTFIYLYDICFYSQHPHKHEQLSLTLRLRPQLTKVFKTLVNDSVGCLPMIIRIEHFF